jgi:hypothetical protein
MKLHRSIEMQSDHSLILCYLLKNNLSEIRTASNIECIRSAPHPNTYTTHHNHKFGQRANTHDNHILGCLNMLTLNNRKAPPPQL